MGNRARAGPHAWTDAKFWGELAWQALGESNPSFQVENLTS